MAIQLNRLVKSIDVFGLIHQSIEDNGFIDGDDWKEKVMSSGNIDKGKSKFRDISCYCIDSKIQFAFKKLQRDKMNLRMFRQMVHRKLCLEDIDEVILMWISDNGHPWTLKNDQCFFWFWDNVVVNGNGFIQLVVKIKNPEWDVTPKKSVSKSPQVRRSPKLGGDKNKSDDGGTARKLFGQGQFTTYSSRCCW